MKIVRNKSELPFGQYKLINVLLLAFRKVCRTQGKRHLIPFINKNDEVINWFLQGDFLVIAAIPGCVCQCVRFAVVWCWTLHLQPADGYCGDGLLSPWLMDAGIWSRSHVHRRHAGAAHSRGELCRVVSQKGTSDGFIRKCLVQNLCPVRSDLCIDATFSPLNPRQVRCWYSLMGNRRQGVRLRRRADRRRGQIRTFMSRWTNSCLTHFFWRSPSTRKMASWLTWRYFIARLFWWDVLSSLVLPHEYKLKKNYIIKYTMKSCRKNQCATRMVWLFRQDRAFRTEAETKKSRVSWDTQICCYLDPSGTNMWAPHTILPPRLLHIYWCKIIVVVFNFAELAIISWGLDILNWFCSRHVINWHCCVFKIQLLDPK